MADNLLGTDIDTITSKVNSLASAMEKLEKSVDKINSALGKMDADRVVGAGSAKFQQPANIKNAGGGSVQFSTEDPGSAPRSMMPMIKAGGEFIAGAWNLGTALLPSAASGINRQQTRFYSAAMMGERPGDRALREGGALQNSFNRQEQAIQSAIGNRLTSVNAAQRVQYSAVTGGIAGQQNVQQLGAFTGWSSLMTGQSNEAAAASHIGTVTSANFQNAALINGIQTKDAQGNYLTGEALYSQVYAKMGIAGLSQEEFVTQMAPGRRLGMQLAALGMSEEEQASFQAYAAQKLENPNYRMGEEKAEGSPAAKSMELTAKEDRRVDQGMSASVKGYEVMTETLGKVNDALYEFYRALGPISELAQGAKGAGVGWSNSLTGNAINSAFGAAETMVGMDMWNSWRGGGGAGGKGGGKGGGASGGGGGLGSRIKGSKGMKGGLKGLNPFRKLGAGAKMGSRFIPGIGWVVGTASGAMSGAEGEGFWGGLGSSILGGGVAGGAVGLMAGGVGAIPGAIAGALGGAAAHTIGYIGGQMATDQGVFADEADTGSKGVVQHRTSAQGTWSVPKAELYKLHEKEMVLPADVAESFRASVQQHLMGATETATSTQTSLGTPSGGLVKVEVTLNNASWGEAQRLVRIVQDAVDTSRTLDTLAST